MNTQTKTPLLSPYFGKLQTTISEIIGIDLEDISYGMEFDELSMTPMELAEFFSKVNAEFSVRLKISDLETYSTLGELAEYIEDEME